MPYTHLDIIDLKWYQTAMLFSRHLSSEKVYLYYYISFRKLCTHIFFLLKKTNNLSILILVWKLKTKYYYIGQIRIKLKNETLLRNEWQTITQRCLSRY